jgi:hypothetical protein
MAFEEVLDRDLLFRKMKTKADNKVRGLLLFSIHSQRFHLSFSLAHAGMILSRLSWQWAGLEKSDSLLGRVGF